MLQRKNVRAALAPFKKSNYPAHFVADYLDKETSERVRNMVKAFAGVNCPRR